MYFLLIRPQQKRAKAHKALLGALKAGDEIVTNGGIVGTVKSVDESFATVEIASGVVVKVQKQGINQKISAAYAGDMIKSNKFIFSPKVSYLIMVLPPIYLCNTSGILILLSACW
jgi:preprotein translocase subunit YajC